MGHTGSIKSIYCHPTNSGNNFKFYYVSVRGLSLFLLQEHDNFSSNFLQIFLFPVQEMGPLPCGT